jgi:hypothetical protein
VLGPAFAGHGKTTYGHAMGFLDKLLGRSKDAAEKTEDTAAQAWDKATDVVGDTAEEAKDKVSDLTDPGGDAATEAADAAAEPTQDTTGSSPTAA